MSPLVHITGSRARLTLVLPQDATWFTWREWHLARLTAARSTDLNSAEQFWLNERFGCCSVRPDKAQSPPATGAAID